MQNSWHTKEVPEIFQELETTERGLAKEEAASRLRDFGENKLPEEKKEKLPAVFFRQFKSPLIYMLLGAGCIVFLVGEITDGLIILAVLLFNATVGTIQEGRAQNTLLALKRFTQTNATVLRDGEELIVRDTQIVPGDVIVLQEGEKVPADARIIQANNLKADEAALTGESKSVHKHEKVVKNPDLPVQEQSNMVLKGTHIVAGNAVAIVVSTGLETFIGKISREIKAIETEIPLKANIRHLSQFIVAIALIIGTTLFFLGILYGNPLEKMFITVVSLLVSIIPEGLPIVMTLVLATGVWRMSKRNALVKRLEAVEALGQAKIIAVDKTGTITKNEMMVKQVYLPGSKAGENGNFFEIGGVGYEPGGTVKLSDREINPLNHQDLLFAGKMCALLANARLMFSQEENQWKVAGDPTEAAMLVMAEKLGFRKDDLKRDAKKVSEIPFDYENKYHAAFHSLGGKAMVSLAGAPETVLSLCQKIKRANRSSVLLKKEKEKLELVLSLMSEKGMRVVALAEGTQKSKILLPGSIGQLAFVGFLGMIDALRPNISQSIKKAALAGIRVVMITGDHEVTAKVIAKEAGIWREEDQVLLGKDIDMLTDSQISQKVNNVSVFARVTPEHKIRIIQAYKKIGQVVAMTGDGVNDAPSLVAADLGISMGKIGTEVAKEASDIVLLDDNFESIISAIEEGRSIYKSIKRVILYLFSTNFGEVFTIAAAIFISLPLPILPAQIIWLNFVTDGFLDVALAMEPKEKGLLSKGYKKPKKYLVDNLMIFRIIIMALTMMAGTIFLFSMYFETDLAKALTVSLTVLAAFQWFNAFNCRSEEKSIFQLNPISNKFLVGAVIIIVLLQLMAVYNPIFQKVLHTAPLSFEDWALIIPIALSIVIVEEIRKYFYRKKLYRKAAHDKKF